MTSPRNIIPVDPVTGDRDEPFGRQPQPVEVRVSGHELDTAYWCRELMRRAEFKGDMVQIISTDAGTEVMTFKIYPRAVND
jgi:hypothetical protein